MKALEALLNEEETSLAEFTSPTAASSEIAETISRLLGMDIPLEEAAEYAPSLEQMKSFEAAFPLTPYLSLMASRVRLLKAKSAFPASIVAQFQSNVAKHEKEVHNLVDLVGKKYGVEIPDITVEIYLVGLAERLRNGVFGNLGPLPEYMGHAAEYGVKRQF